MITLKEINKHLATSNWVDPDILKEAFNRLKLTEILVDSILENKEDKFLHDLAERIKNGLIK